MAEVRSVVCDMCGQHDAHTYSVGEPGKTPWLVDLCPVHAHPITEWEQHGRRGSGRRAYRRFSKTAAVPRYDP